MILNARQFTQKVNEQNDFSEYVGKEAKNNPSNGEFDIDAPTPDSKNIFSDKKIWNDNLEQVYLSMKSGSDFLVQGESGWSKTTIIRQMAKKCGYTVITVYLDKAYPEDFQVFRNGKTVPPLWARYIIENPDKQFLLFFDDIDQADSKILNMIMPIVVEHKLFDTKCSNYFCCGCGNNLDNMPRPLVNRFGGIMTWITGTRDSWSDAFDYLHKMWDEKISKNVVNAFEKYCMDFASPRDLEKNIFEMLYKLKKSMNGYSDERISEKTIENKIKRNTLSIEGKQKNTGGNAYNRDIESHVKELARVCYNFVNSR